MSYSTTNPPRLLTPAFQNNASAGGAGFGLWGYSSTADNISTIATTGYITNALNLGMKVNDIVLVQGSSLVTTMHMVLTVTSTGADLSDGTVVVSTANAA